MSDKIISLWFFVIFIPSIYLFYKLMQCFNFEKTIRAGKSKEFKVVYILICIILAGLLAFVFSLVLQNIYNALVMVE